MPRRRPLPKNPSVGLGFLPRGAILPLRELKLFVLGDLMIWRMQLGRSGRWPATVTLSCTMRSLRISEEVEGLGIERPLWPVAGDKELQMER